MRLIMLSEAVKGAHPEVICKVSEFLGRKASLTYIPSVQIDETTAIQRFGAPAEVIHTGEQESHLLYPDRGLDIILHGKGREVLQYVAPRDFESLRKPLVPAHDN